jgi:hypothetical protein
MPLGPSICVYCSPRRPDVHSGGGVCREVRDQTVTTVGARRRESQRRACIVERFHDRPPSSTAVWADGLTTGNWQRLPTVVPWPLALSEVLCSHHLCESEWDVRVARPYRTAYCWTFAEASVDQDT